MDLSNFKKTVERDVAKIISQDLQNAALSIIENFYDDYEPTLYKRTYNIKANKISNGSYGGVSIDIGSHELDMAVDVFMWMYGMRGLPETGRNGWVNPCFMTFTAKMKTDIFNLTASSPDMLMRIITEDPVLWGNARKKQVDSIVTSHLNKLQLFN